MSLQIRLLSLLAHKWLGKDGRCWLGRERNSRTRKTRMLSSKSERKGQVALQKYRISCSRLLDLVGFGLDFISFSFSCHLLAAAGAIVVEWNVRDPGGSQASAGMWNSHIR